MAKSKKYRFSGIFFAKSFGDYRKTSTFAPTNEPTNEKGKEKAADLKGRKRIKSTGKGRQFFRANQQTNEVFNEKWQKWK